MIKITRADGSQIPVWLDSGCPVVDEAIGDQSMEEVEANNRYTAGIQKICVNVNNKEGACRALWRRSGCSCKGAVLTIS